MSHRILLIDDDELVLLSVQSLLEAEGFQTRTAANGAEALEKAGKEQFDVFLLDLIMPGMSGFQVCESLRKMDSYRETPIVMLTAKSAHADRERGLAVGATLFLPKPIDPDRLLEALHEVVGRE